MQETYIPQRPLDAPAPLRAACTPKRLTLSDVDPAVAFVEGDPRRTEYLDRSTLDRVLSFIKQAKGSVNVRTLHWNLKAFQKK